MNPEKYSTDIITLSKIIDKIELIDIVTLSGGRTSLYCKNLGEKFWIRTVHDGFEDKPYKKGYWPGGLYLNEDLIEYNSKEEKSLIKILSKIKVPEEWYSIYHEELKTNDGQITEELIAFIIGFLKSEKYISLAQKTGRL